MRFLSPIAAYRVIVRHQDIEILASGQPRVIKDGFTVEFKEGDLTDFERDYAREHLTFKHNYINLDGSPYDPVPHASSYDTSQIEDPVMRKEVEDFLTTHQFCGNPNEYVVVETPKIPAPWPNYDDITIHGRRTAQHVAEQNLATAEATGTPIDALIAYERSNRNDADIVAAYEAANTPEEVPEDELVEA